MHLEAWLEQNGHRIDWSYFASPWDEMQLRYNPYRFVKFMMN